MGRQEVLVLDVSSEPELIREYIDYHQPGNVPQAIVESIRKEGNGILNMRIYNFSNRLVMIMDVEDDFSFERKAQSDTSNPEVEKWETLMEKFQRDIPDPTGQQKGKWKVATKCFDLSEH